MSRSFICIELRNDSNSEVLRELAMRRLRSESLRQVGLLHVLELAETVCD